MAACACGELSIALRGEPMLVGMCHCLQCQRRTGSLFGAACLFDMSQVVAITGPERTWTRAGDSGRTVTFHFCPQCGSSVFWTRDHRPDLMTVAVGAFSDPTFPPGSVAMWTEHRHAWLALPEDLRQFPQGS